MSSLPAMSANFVGELGESGDEDECGSGDCWVNGSLPGSRWEAKGSSEVTEGLPVGVLSMPLAAAELDIVTAFATSTSEDAKCSKRQEGRYVCDAVPQYEVGKARYVSIRKLREQRMCFSEKVLLRMAG